MTTPSNEDLSRLSLGEEIWSRGSLTDPLDFKASSPLQAPFYEKLKDKPKLYRYEQGGILVYSSNARISGDIKNSETASSKPATQTYTYTGKDLLKKSDPRGKK
jgi:hypothetical protein